MKGITNERFDYVLFLKNWKIFAMYLATILLFLILKTLTDIRKNTKEKHEQAPGGPSQHKLLSLLLAAHHI